MIYKHLGNTQLKISALGQGTIGAGSYSNTAPERIRRRIEVLRYGIELGMTFLDTGEDYEDGHAEEILGKAIRGIREEVFISSKFKPSNNSLSGVMNSIDGSLERLQTDYIDLYQIQWPNPSIPISETMAALSNLIEQGKIRFVGVCNFNLSQLEEAQSFFDQGKIVSLQTDYNLRNRLAESDILPYSESNHITVIAYGSFGQGKLCFSDPEQETLNLLSKKYTVTVPQVILNWLISHPTVATITRTMNFAHTKDNAGAADFGLSAEDITLINKVFKGETTLISTRGIRVADYDADETHLIYTTLEQAMKNALNIQPSPMDLAQEIKNGMFLRPVELVPTIDKSGSYEYDLIRGRVRYWAWVIANGYEVPIPAYILG